MIYDEPVKASSWRTDCVMCPLRRVADDQAGPSAVGILTPPGRRTFLIVRPRSLFFDLLLLSDARGLVFRDFDREQASRVAEALFDALKDRALNSLDHFEVTAVGDAMAKGFHVRVHVGVFHLLVCARQPGQPYAPLLFPDVDTARTAMSRLSELLCPPTDIEQEVYLNTYHFQR